ncbi:MAG: hydantoinase/oxoprolinase family protein [Halobacteriota archaeon]|uniref:hydantoinase/oxoprolinase family protein n=1 Tax=Natronomonas sp. TaxID=2184060 RepID=UPI003974CDCD
MRKRIGFDVGGTFTDFTMIDSETGAVDIFKHPTTEDPADGVLSGVQRFLAETDTAWTDIDQLIHATTLATNTVLERDGATTALLVTEGFRDVSILGRQKRYDLYDMQLQKQDPIVPREHIYEVRERIHPRAGVVRDLDDDGVRALIAELDAEYDAVAVSLLHSYHDDTHERQVGDLVAEAAPGLAVSLSSDLSGLFREYERTNTAAIDAYIKPRIREYLGTIETALAEFGYDDTFFMMKSSGGLATPKTIRHAPVQIIESGPVAGSLNSATLATELGYENVFSFDMGGTTAKICFIVDGEPHRTDVFEVDELEMKTDSGIPINLSVVDMIEISAGGGSIAAVEETGAISVGPESAGATPGPICYGFGGTRPTITDADLALGYLNPENFLGGEMALDRDGAVAGIERAVADPLDLDVETAAWGIKTVVDNSMMQASRIHAAERGIDLREFGMIAFGGAGPMHAAFVAAELSVPEVIVPAQAGVASAMGLLAADVEFHLGRTDVARLGPDSLDRINRIFRDLERDGRERIADAGGASGEVIVERTAKMKYTGQAHDLSVDVPDGEFDESDLETIAARFNRTYAETYGYSDSDEPIEGVTWNVTVRRVTATPDLHAANAVETDRTAHAGTRRAYFRDGFLECDIYDRRGLDPGTSFTGPAIVEERNATTVVPPDDAVSVDEYGNLVISIGGR